MGLLRTNHQLRNELLELVDHRLASGNLTAELDLMFKGYQSWGTWLHCPLFVRPTSRAWVEKNPDTNSGVYSWAPANLDVKVNLRIFSTEGFRSNDGWPRQPGSGLRDLLVLLLRFVEFGPDFGHHASTYKEMSRSLHSESEPEESSDESGGERTIHQEGGCKIYRINTLSVHVTFHDIYTRATHPETVHQIFKALKELALAGLFLRGLKVVQARATFTQQGKEVEWENEWCGRGGPDQQILWRWNTVGLIRIEGSKLKLF
jgi:hypothetical protein